MRFTLDTGDRFIRDSVDKVKLFSKREEDYPTYVDPLNDAPDGNKMPIPPSESPSYPYLDDYANITCGEVERSPLYRNGNNYDVEVDIIKGITEA